MINPLELSKKSEKMLHELSFELTQSNENSWTKSFEWTNNDMQFVIYFDRMYYDSYVLPKQKPFENLYLIKLLRFLKNDPSFYAQELRIANLAYTLALNEYIQLFYKNYDLVKDFVSRFSKEKLDSYDKYIVYYKGI
ncbi:MAG: hypothetical protein V4556_07385 [Bacteroidota bacterium]